MPTDSPRRICSGGGRALPPPSRRLAGRRGRGHLRPLRLRLLLSLDRRRGHRGRRPLLPVEYHKSLHDLDLGQTTELLPHLARGAEHGADEAVERAIAQGILVWCGILDLLELGE